jgi:DNA-binding transcriptional ArsR family regulator
MEMREEFGVTQPAVSMHLRVLRDDGFATVRAGRRRPPPVRRGHRSPPGAAVVERTSAFDAPRLDEGA